MTGDPGNLPHSIEAEEQLLSSCLLDGGGVISRCLDAHVRAASFFDPRHGVIFGKLVELHRTMRPIAVEVLAEELKATRQLDAIGGMPFLLQVSSRVPTTAEASYFIERVLDHSMRRSLIKSALETIEDCSRTGEDIVALAPKIQARFSASASIDLCGSTGALEPRRAGGSRVITPEVPVVSLAGTPICTRGNVQMVTALQKQGKTAAVGGILGAIIGGPDSTGDTLHFAAENPLRHAVVHWDTEQAVPDHERLFQTALARAGSKAPPWLYSYSAKGMSVDELRRHLARLPRELEKRHGGVCAIILDGVADFVNDPNDPKETNPFVTELEAIATRHKCAVISVLHLNPAPAGTPTKSRGHLGSQLERKCETDIRLTKDADGITTMYTASARRAPILQADGPRFSWSNEAGMHASLHQTGGMIRDSVEIAGLRDLAEEVFGDDKPLRYGEALKALRTALSCSKKTAERKFTMLTRRNVIARNQANRWMMAA